MTDRHKMLNGVGSNGFDKVGSARLVADHNARMAAKMAAEAGRIAEVVARGIVPDACGPDIPAAPARGAFQVFRPMTIVPGSAGTAVPAGYRAPGEGAFRAAIRRADVFDMMERDARLAHERAGADTPFVAPFTPAQVQMGRDYRDLTERHAAGGVRCASLEAGRGGGGSGGEFIDAYVDEGLRLAALHRRIGAGAAISVRRIRPGRRGSHARGIILDRALVDMVCLCDKRLGQVLRKHGWEPDRKLRDALALALAAALDRMLGYGVHPSTKGIDR